MNRKLSFTLVGLLVSLTVNAQELEIDHVWIHVDMGAPESSELSDVGIHIDQDTGTVRHIGQGTASIFVRFENIYLELIWVEDKDLLKSKTPQEYSHSLIGSPETSPFGIGLRYLDGDPEILPFDNISYWAEFMRPLVSLTVAKPNGNLQTDPTIFVVPHYMRWDLRTKEQPNLLSRAVHSTELRQVTSVRIYGPGLPSDSSAVQYLANNGIIEFIASNSKYMELEFDNGGENSIDLRPTLPLILYH